MSKKIRGVLSSILILTFLLTSISVGYAQTNSIVKTVPPINAQQEVFIPATPAEQQVLNGWVRVGYYYGNKNIENIGSMTTSSIAMSLCTTGMGLVYTALLGIAQLFQEYAQDDDVTAYYRREMWKSQDNPIYWRDKMTYYYDSAHTHQAGPIIQSNIYEMVEKTIPTNMVTPIFNN